MSKGLGKLQRTIISLLDGSDRPQCFSCGSRPIELTTPEIYEELVEREILPNQNQKTEMQSVRRACVGLVKRNLVDGKYVSNDPLPNITISWYLKAEE